MRFSSVVCHSNPTGTLTGLLGRGSDTENCTPRIWTIEKAQDEWSQQRAHSMDAIPESRVSPALTPAYFLSLFRLRGKRS